MADYIAAGKPVLALSPARGVVADLAQQGGIRRVDLNDEGGIAAAIGDFYKAFVNGELTRFNPPEVFVRHISPPAVAEKFLDAVESICRKSV